MFRMECSWISRSIPAIEEHILVFLPFSLLFFSFKGQLISQHSYSVLEYQITYPVCSWPVYGILTSIMINLIAY